MKILILITKDNRQLLKLVQYNKLIKSAKTKVSKLNKESNKLKVIKGNIKEKFDFIQSIYKKKKEFNFNQSDFFEMEITPYINGMFSFFNMDKADIKENYLETEYNKQITENKNQVLQYNIINVPSYERESLERQTEKKRDCYSCSFLYEPSGDHCNKCIAGEYSEFKEASAVEKLHYQIKGV